MVNIRKATQKDIEQFKEVIKSSILELCKDFYTPAQLMALLDQFPNSEVYKKWIDERVLLVADDKGIIVGFAQYTPELALIEAVHVKPSYACRGIGKKLVDKIEDFATNQGTTNISLESSINAEKFYIKCSYKKIKLSKYICKNGVELETIAFDKSLNH